MDRDRETSPTESMADTEATMALAAIAEGTKQVTKPKKRRPARKQAEAKKLADQAPKQTGHTYNIWYSKWSGGDNDPFSAQEHAETRCNIAKDSGYTRADRIPGSYFCLFFARGMCPNGHTCSYLHRLPTIHDMFSPNVDCFGRDKHADYRDDMGGVGSFMRQNLTLYIGRIHVTDDIEEIVARHFSEWGEIERIRILNSRGVAFVTYKNEVNAQFAMVAMAHQSLDHNEILNVRWATLDPNPLAMAREKRRLEEQAAEAIRRALPAEFVAEIEGGGDDEDDEGSAATKRRRIEEGSFGLPGYEAPDSIWYNRDKLLHGGSTGSAALAIEAPSDDKEIFGEGTLARLQALKSKASGSKPPATTATPVSKAPVTGGGLGFDAYASDDDDEE